MSLDQIDDIERLRRINNALMNRVESAMDQQGNAFSLFQTALNLEGQVRRRTDELTNALHRVEKINLELEKAKVTAEQANLSKTRFLAAASHDVLQPLNAALLSLSILGDLQTSEKGSSLVRQVEHTLQTMNELLRTLLDISRLDAGVVTPRFETTPLPAILSSLKTDFAPVAEKKGLDLRFRDRPFRVQTDKTMLRRILQNLLSNALRYTSRGGVLIGVRKQGPNAVIEVVDTGWGIAADEYETIFEEFHRGKQMLDDGQDGAGLGLGLSIVRRMVSALGHELTLQSNPNVGTKFRLSIPIVDEMAVTATDEPANHVPMASSNLAGKKILLIENDKSVSAAMNALLSSWQCEIRSGATAKQSLTALQGRDRWVPQLIIADQQLDEGDLGTSAVAEIRSVARSPIPAIIVTANPNAELDTIISEMDVELMHKPVKPAQLRALASHMLSGR